jgi:hypothetical protein
MAASQVHQTRWYEVALKAVLMYVIRYGLCCRVHRKAQP